MGYPRRQEPPSSHETLTPQMLRYERLFLGLRQRRGLPVQEEGLEEHAKLLQQLVAAGLARLDADRLSLTRRGWLVSDAIVLQLVTALEGEAPRVDKRRLTSLHSV